MKKGGKFYEKENIHRFFNCCCYDNGNSYNNAITGTYYNCRSKIKDQIKCNKKDYLQRENLYIKSQRNKEKSQMVII